MVRIFRSILSVFLMGVMLVGVFSCSKDDDSSENDTYTRSVLVYISAQNSLKGNVDNDVIEMLAGVSRMGDRDRLVLFLDDNNRSRFFEIDRYSNAKTLYNLTPIYTYPDNLNSASPQVFDQVLDYFFKNYKAKSYGLVLWSHGSGWNNASTSAPQRRSFAVDDATTGTTRMQIADMASVLSKYPTFEYILFDACFMQTIEVAYELRAAAKYIIGSPAEIPGAGAPYKDMIPSLFLQASDGQVAESIVNAYGDCYNQRLTSSGGVVLSAIRTSEFDAFVSVMAQLFSKYRFLDATKYAKCLNYYFYEWNSKAPFKSPDAYDIQGIMMQVMSSDSEDYRLWENAFYKLSPYVSIASDWFSAYTHALMPVDRSQCGAVCMYLPLDKYKNDPYFDYYKKTQWGKLFDIQ